MLWQKKELVVRNDLSYDNNQRKQGISNQSRGIDGIAKKFATRVYEMVFVNF